MIYTFSPLENSEKVVLKDELLKAVWPDTFMEESNLTSGGFCKRSLAAYREFSELRKTVDPDVPVLKQARLK